MSVPFRHMLNSAEHSFFSHLKHVKNTDNTELNWSLAELTQIPEVTLQTGAPCHPCSIAQSCLRTGEEQPLPSLFCCSKPCSLTRTLAFSPLMLCSPKENTACVLPPLQVQSELALLQKKNHCYPRRASRKVTEVKS